MTIDFDTFCQELTASNTFPAHPAEIHGLGCGILAAGFRPNAAALSQQISAYVDEPCTLNQVIVDSFQESLQSLEGDDFEFQLCLPDDDVYGLTERVESLSAWCIGFLHGFAAVQNPLSKEAQELLRDLTEISQVDAAALESDGSDNDQNEADYTELTEFVRMAALSLFMDNNARRQNEQENNKHARH